MNRDLELLRHLKRYFRQTWVYQTKLWIESHTPAGLRHHKKTLALYSQFLHSGELCFDVGANIGNRTQVFSELGARTISIEPQEVCLKQLHQRFRGNSNVVIVNKAVGDYEGYAEISICEEANTISTMSNRWITDGRFSNNFKWSKKQFVPITTLDNLIDIYGLPKFCKIDVEGFELSVLNGLTRQIQFISFEFNIELKLEMKKCIEYLQSIGQSEFNYSIGESMELVFAFWVKSEELYEHLNIASDKLLWGDIYVKFA